MKQAVPLCVANAAPAYLAAGLCVLPAMRCEKRPAIGAWKPYQKRLPTAAELSAWMARNPDALCIICGAVSGHLEVIDFDDAKAFRRWYECIPVSLRDCLVIEETPSGGFHVIYRCEVEVCGNIKLAQRKGDDGKVIALIETRGEGGLFLCAPTQGYVLIEGKLTESAILTEIEREVLLHAAWELNEYEPPQSDRPESSCTSPAATAATQRRVLDRPEDEVGLRPGDDFSAHGDVRPILRKHGWTLVGDDGENEKWKRPGKEGAGHSATLNTKGVFYNFSSNAAPFEAHRGYGPFQVYTLLEHGDDEVAAVRALRELGYGDEMWPIDDGIDLTSFFDWFAKRPMGKADAEYEPLFTRVSDLVMTRPDWLLRGTLERDTFAMMFGDPGCGKSFLAIDWSCRIATGAAWRGYEVKEASVAYIAGEGRAGLVRRFRAWQQHHETSLDGKPLFTAASMPMTNPEALDRLLEAIDREIGQPALVVMDTVARNFGPGDENSTQDMSRFVAACDMVRHRFGCTVLLVHHTGHGEKNRARGAMALKAALDAEYKLENTGDGVRVLSATKMKEAEEPDSLQFKLTSVTLDGVVGEYGEQITSAAVELLDANINAVVAQPSGDQPRGKWQKLGLDIARELIEAEEGPANIKTWHAACEAAGMPKRRRYEIAAKLPVENGFIDDAKFTDAVSGFC